MTLHLVFSQRGYDNCEKRCNDEDVIVLLGDGVYAQQTRPISATTRVLTEDLTIRGVNVTNNHTLSYPELVELCEKNSPIMSWND